LVSLDLPRNTKFWPQRHNSGRCRPDSGRVARIWSAPAWIMYLLLQRQKQDTSWLIICLY